MRPDKLLHSKFGDLFTKRFLQSKHVVIISESDFIHRVRICVKILLLIPFFAIFTGLLLYYTFYVNNNYDQAIIIGDEERINLFKQQRFVILSMLIIFALNFLIVSSLMIVMLNMTMGKGTTIVTVLFNIFYIAEALFFGSFLFIFDAVGLLDFSTYDAGFIEIIRTQWIWILVYFIALFTFLSLKTVFKDINGWHREWIRIEKYRNMEDKENAFVFKTWITPSEINARIKLIVAAWFCIFIASVYHVFDLLNLTDFTVLKWIILAFGYITFIAAYVVPFNKVSLYVFWTLNIFLTGVFIYTLVIIQTEAWKPEKWAYYGYIAMLIPWSLSLDAAIRYTWSIRNAEEIKAIVVNEFESFDDFADFVEQQSVENKRQEDQEFNDEALDIPVPNNALNV